MTRDLLVYNLNMDPLAQESEKPLGKLLEKIIEKGNRVLILCPSEAELEALDKSLWTYEQLSFLLHGSKNTPSIKSIIKEIPIYLSCEVDKDLSENPNDANILLVTDKDLYKQIIKDYSSLLDDYQKVILFLKKVESIDEITAVNDNDHNNSINITLWQRDNEGRWRKEI